MCVVYGNILNISTSLTITSKEIAAIAFAFVLAWKDGLSLDCLSQCLLSGDEDQTISTGSLNLLMVLLTPDSSQAASSQGLAALV